MYKETKLLKKYDYPSWGLARRIGDNGEIIYFKDNQVTNWTKYIEASNNCSLEATGYSLNLYKRNKGIKGAAIKKVKQIDLLDGENYQIRKVDFVKDFKAGLIQYGLNHRFIR